MVMYKKVLFLGLAASLLGGCDTEPGDNKLEQEQQIAPKASSTAIFLPGGGGIDFGKEPTTIREGVDRGTPYKLVVFEFSENVEDVDLAVSKVLSKYGYSKRVIPDEKLELRAVYSKDNHRVLFRYSSIFKEGFNKKTKLVISWAIK